MPKPVWFSVLVCIGLGLFYFLTKNDQVKVGIHRLELNLISAKEVDRILIRGQEQAELRLNEGVWQVFNPASPEQHYLANTEYVDDLFVAVETLESELFATNKKENQELFMVDSSSGTRVTLFDGARPVWDLIVGKEAGLKKRYVRQPGLSEIFVAQGHFSDLRRVEVNDWRERNILAIQEEDIIRVSLKQKTKSLIEFEWQNESWIVRQKGQKTLQKSKVKSEKVDQLMQGISYLRAVSFLDMNNLPKDVASSFQKPDFELLIYDKTDGFYSLILAKDKSTGLKYAKIKGKDEIFEVTSYSFNQFAVSFAEFAATKGT